MDINPAENSSIVERAKAILLKPKETWPVIDRDPTPSGEIFTRYVIPLAAIGPVCAFIGGQIFGYGFLWARFKPSLFGGLTSAITSFIATLIGVLVITFIANLLAPKFGGESNSRSAFKLVAYSMTAGWVASVFDLIPALGFLALLGLYSLYLFYTGAQPLLKVPREKAAGYTAVTVLCVLLLGLIAGAILGAIGGTMGLLTGGWSTRSTDENVTLNLPGGGSIDTGKLDEAAQKIEEAVKTGNGKAIAPATLQGLLPQTIGNYSRTAVESVAAGPAGSHAEGTYESGGKSYKLSISDMSAIGAMAGIGAALGVESNREDADGYERTTTQNGNLIVEKWHKADSDGSYGQMIGKRFFVEAEGEASSIDDLKAAVASIDPGKLSTLAN